jgi:hypothetical protein
MKKEFMPYEQALALKELGFDEEQYLGWYESFYSSGTPHLQTEWLEEYLDFDILVPAPLYQQAFRWFREKYGLFYDILQYIDKDWKYTTYSDNVDDFLQSGFYNTYEEAELACLKELIDMVKEKK